MTDTEGRLESGGTKLAWRRTAGAAPTLIWLGGFRSDMLGTKASALADWAAGAGRDFLRFDYFGHGASEGEFEAGTITRWRADTLAIIDHLTDGPLILVGSSMGGWLACLAALVRPERVVGLLLIAPAADFTSRLLQPEMDKEARASRARDGVWRRTSAYDPEGYPISRALLEDGARWSILDAPIAIEAPVRIMHGGADEDVPWRHGLELTMAIKSHDVVFTLVREGDHRLSRPADLGRIIAFAEELIGLASPRADC
jgi:pimeloyl-ACP methyl ester carboxylesterase